MTRVLSGVAMAAAAFAVIWWLPGNALLGVVLVVATLAFFEYARLVAAIGAELPYGPALVATLGACVMGAMPFMFGMMAIPAFGVTMLAVAVTLMWRGVHGAPLVNGAASAMLAPLYIGVPLGALVAIHGAIGREGVLTLIAAVAASDTCQYYAGRTFGRRPLALTISPKKTIEGAIGGLVLAPLVLVALAQWSLPGMPPLAVWAVGLGLVVAGIAGDLFESALKRAAGMKDSGALIPGHGGVLDRIDALLFCAPLFTLLLWAA